MPRLPAEYTVRVWHCAGFTGLWQYKQFMEEPKYHDLTEKITQLVNATSDGLTREIRKIFALFDPPFSPSKYERGEAQNGDKDYQPTKQVEVAVSKNNDRSALENEVLILRVENLMLKKQLTDSIRREVEHETKFIDLSVENLLKRKRDLVLKLK